MNCFFLILPVFALRYLLVACINRSSLQVLNYFPAGQGKEEVGRKLYLLVNTFLLFVPVLLDTEKGLIPHLGFALYGISIIMYLSSLISFCHSDGLVKKGLYSFSRNPQALSFILLYLSISLISKSLFYGLMILPLTWAFKMLAISEERWCQQKYGRVWDEYMVSTKRFLISPKSLFRARL